MEKYRKTADIDIWPLYIPAPKYIIPNMHMYTHTNKLLPHLYIIHIPFKE